MFHNVTCGVIMGFPRRFFLIRLFPFSRFLGLLRVNLHVLWRRACSGRWGLFSRWRWWSWSLRDAVSLNMPLSAFLKLGLFALHKGSCL